MASMTSSVPSGASEGADATECDRDPIHVPGTIQPGGALLVLDPARLTILRAAGRTAELLGLAPAALLGQPLGKLFDPARVRALRALLARDDLDTPLHALDPDLRLGAVPVDASV